MAGPDLHRAFTCRAATLHARLIASSEVIHRGETPMKQAASQGIGALRSVLDGPVLTPDDTGFDDRRRVWNAGIDRRPAAIARCASAADVAAAIRYAQENDLEMS